MLVARPLHGDCQEKARQGGVASGQFPPRQMQFEDIKGTVCTGWAVYLGGRGGGMGAWSTGSTRYLGMGAGAANKGSGPGRCSPGSGRAQETGAVSHTQWVRGVPGQCPAYRGNGQVGG